VYIYIYIYIYICILLLHDESYEKVTASMAYYTCSISTIILGKIISVVLSSIWPVQLFLQNCVHTQMFVTMYGISYLVWSWVQLHTSNDQ
jgi:hypothetical protein